MGDARDTPWSLQLGDCLPHLRAMAADTVDALVTDPPAGINFLGNTWDAFKSAGLTELQAFQEAMVPVFAECLRVLKPGAHGVVWALPRTAHHTTMALERAGFEVRDVVVHLQSQGMPKSQGVLKPAAEHWVLVRKPPEGTLKATQERYGTGGLNIDACRIEHASTQDPALSQARNPGRNEGTTSAVYGSNRPQQRVNVAGRWPPNAALEHDARCVRVSAGVPAPGPRGHAGQQVLFGAQEKDDGAVWACVAGCAVRDMDDAAGEQASRFFYTSKCPPSEKVAALTCACQTPEVLPLKRAEDAAKLACPACGQTREMVTHPTPKGGALMAWLLRLVVPSGGTVLDPFTGTGSTGVGALEEGFRFVGMERDPVYCAMARYRLGEAQPGGTR